MTNQPGPSEAKVLGDSLAACITREQEHHKKYDELLVRFETLKTQTVKIAKDRDHWKQKAENAAGALDHVFKTIEDARHDFHGTAADSVAKLLTPPAKKVATAPEKPKDDGDCPSCQ